MRLSTAASALLALPGLLAFTAGCGGGETTPVTVDPCADMAATCLVNQQACVVKNGAASCEACGAGQFASPESGKCEALGGTAMSHDFDPQTTEAGEEILGLCRSWTLNNATELWFNAVELDQDEASHHSNWMFVPDNMYTGPDGVWKCSDRKYSQLTAALAGGVLYAQSTQAKHEVQKFPNGAAVRIPPYSKIISDIHLLNTTSAPITGHAKISVYSLPLDQVKIKLTPFHLTYDGLNIPPHAKSRFYGDCAVGDKFPGAGGVPFNMKVYYTLPHTHALGTKFFLDIMGGPDDGKAIFAVDGFNGEARGRAYDPPVDMKGSKGFRFGCEFFNPRSDFVKWGFGDQEMCEVLGFAESKVGFESTVATANADGSDGATQVFTGDCSTDAFLWDNDKTGGPGPM